MRMVDLVKRYRAHLGAAAACMGLIGLVSGCDSNPAAPSAPSAPSGSGASGPPPVAKSLADLKDDDKAPSQGGSGKRVGKRATGSPKGVGTAEP